MSDNKSKVKDELLKIKESFGMKVLSGKSFPFKFSVEIVCPDDFPVDLTGLKIHYSLSEKYPSEPAEVEKAEALGDDESLPALCQQKIITALTNRVHDLFEAGDSMMCLGASRHCLSKLRDLLVDAKFTETYLGTDSMGSSIRRFILVHPKLAAAAAAPIVRQTPPSSDHESENEEEAGDGGRDYCSDSDDHSSGDSEEEDHSEMNKMCSLKNVGMSVPGKASLLLLDGVNLQNVAVLECTELHAVLRCSACDGSDKIVVPANGETKSKCPKCNLPWHAEFSPLPITQGTPDCFGVLILDSCHVFDIINSPFQSICLNCSSLHSHPFLRVRSQSNETTCQHCHTNLNPLIATVRTASASDRVLVAQISNLGGATGMPPIGVAGRKPGGGSSSGVRKKTGPKAVPLVGVTPGHPLPDRGICKHYRHSYRWLRFPCCGQAFPCDICHEEKADHSPRWANRMICGYCSVEQSCGGLCKACGKTVASSGRKQLNLASKDSKMKGVFKTVSKKAAKSQQQQKKH